MIFLYCIDFILTSVFLRLSYQFPLFPSDINKLIVLTGDCSIKTSFLSISASEYFTGPGDCPYKQGQKHFFDWLTKNKFIPVKTSCAWKN
jgi:hypothetical protein